MSKTSRSIYVANAWKTLITTTAIQYFEINGYFVDGNWINNRPFSEAHNIVLLAPAHFNDAVILNPYNHLTTRFFSHLLFPDELVGWDRMTNKYLMQQNKEFIPLLECAPILSQSKYTLRLASDAYQDNLHSRREVTHLPIEFNSIRDIANEEKTGMGVRPIRVVWSHMWRSDKGFLEALGIIEQLSRVYRNIEFVVGRAYFWGGPDVEELKQKTASLLDVLQRRNNVRFQSQIPMKNVVGYWRSLVAYDIGFSVSHHEGFGLGMLEQATAGIACVVPNREAYIELQAGLVTDNIAEAIAELIDNPIKRVEIAQKGCEAASRFNAEDWARRILSIIQ